MHYFSIVYYVLCCVVYYSVVTIATVNIFNNINTETEPVQPENTVPILFRKGTQVCYVKHFVFYNKSNTLCVNKIIEFITSSVKQRHK